MQWTMSMMKSLERKETVYMMLGEWVTTRYPGYNLIIVVIIRIVVYRISLLSGFILTSFIKIDSGIIK